MKPVFGICITFLFAFGLSQQANGKERSYGRFNGFPNRGEEATFAIYMEVPAEQTPDDLQGSKFQTAPVNERRGPIGTGLHEDLSQETSESLLEFGVKHTSQSNENEGPGKLLTNSVSLMSRCFLAQYNSLILGAGFRFQRYQFQYNNFETFIHPETGQPIDKTTLPDQLNSYAAFVYLGYTVNENNFLVFETSGGAAIETGDSNPEHNFSQRFSWGYKVTNNLELIPSGRLAENDGKTELRPAFGVNWQLSENIVVHATLPKFIHFGWTLTTNWKTGFRIDDRRTEFQLEKDSAFDGDSMTYKQIDILPFLKYEIQNQFMFEVELGGAVNRSLVLSEKDSDPYKDYRFQGPFDVNLSVGYRF